MIELGLQKLTNWFDVYVADARGNVAIMFAVAAIPILMVAGVAVDFSRALNLRTQLQAATDSAALAGASMEDASNGQRIQIAKDILSENLSGQNVSPISTVTIDDGEITVDATTELDNSFMRIAGIYTSDVSASATAVFASNVGPCVLTLAPSGNYTMLLNSNSMIDAPDCHVQVNSSDDEALKVNSNSDITAKSICVDGGWLSTGSSQLTPSPTQCAPVDDPLANLPVPDEADDPCNWTDHYVEGTVTLQPGVYCGGLELSANANVTFAEGIYVIRDAELIISTNSTATGSGVMFYLTGSNNSRFNINSNSHIEFSAPTSGTYAGIVFFQARDAISNFSILNSDSSSIVEGVIYLPNSELRLNSNGHISDSSPWTAIIVKTLMLASNSTLHINMDYESSSVPVPAGIGGDGERQLVRLKR